ncbi:hypothetical protein [Aeromicrobium sp. UC242_57]|uniref:hypothetical protein n=1 Tax=Aeromicrobium sp. UC242_57 TaxID=3374624 RepID=UPI003788C1B8
MDPDQVVMVPHPSYQGLYADRLGDRERAREALGVPPDRRAVLFFGQLRLTRGCSTCSTRWPPWSRTIRRFPCCCWLAGQSG